MKKGWETRRLADVATLQRGFDLPTRKRVAGNYPLVSSSGIIDTHNEGPVSAPGVATGRSGSIGNVFFIEKDYWPLNTVLYVKDFHGNDQRFVYHLLRNLELNRFSSGAGVPTLNRNVVHEELVNIPPLPEQQRIVAKLDEAFEGIAKAKENAEKNVTNARAIFESELNAIFTKKGEGWEEVKLDDTCIVERGSSPRPIKAYLTDQADGVNWIKIGDTKGVTKYITKTREKITQAGALKSRKVDPGDFILTNSMTYGRPYIMATTGYIHDGWFVLRMKEGIDNEFFYYLLSSKVVQDQFASLAAGAVVKNISSDLVKRAVLPIPPKEQQILIAKSIDTLVEETQRLESIYQRKLNELDALKKSILHHAFTGQL